MIMRQGQPERVVLDPEICHGKPIIRGTRVMVGVLLASLAGGDSIEEVAAAYGIDADDVRAAIAFAGGLVDREQHLPLKRPA